MAELFSPFVRQPQPSAATRGDRGLESVHWPTDASFNRETETQPASTPGRADFYGPTFVHQGTKFGAPYPLPGVASIEILREAAPQDGFRCFDVVFYGPNGERVCGFDAYPFKALGAAQPAAEPGAVHSLAA